MKIIYDMKKILKNNCCELVPLPYLPINGYSRGYALMLSDGKHEGICFPGYITKDDVIDAACANAIPDGLKLYIIKANGRDSRNPSHIRWALYAECIE